MCVEPIMNESKLLSLFGGCEENVKYYLDLREALAAARRRGDAPVTYDPRDTLTKARLDSLQWRPRVDVRQFDNFIGCSDEELYGHCNKQTAVDESNNNDDDDETNCGDEETKDASTKSKQAGDDSGSFVCGVHGCCEAFSSLANYESHYYMCHNYVCSHCKRSLASSFLLDLHLEENHDSYFQILSSRIDMYRCLVESCGTKFRTPELRKDHLVVDHKFPASFSFHQPLKSRTNDEKSSDLNSPARSNRKAKTFKKKGQSGVPVMDIDEEDSGRVSLSKNDVTRTSRGSKNGASNGTDMECDIGGDGSNKPTNSTNQGKRGRGGRGNFVPRAICFGRGAQRAFRSRGRGGHWHQWGRGHRNTSTDIEQMDFKDLSDALQD